MDGYFEGLHVEQPALEAGLKWDRRCAVIFLDAYSGVTTTSRRPSSLSIGADGSPQCSFVDARPCRCWEPSSLVSVQLG